HGWVIVRDAERPGRRSHAERGNERNERNERTRGVLFFDYGLRTNLMTRIVSWLLFACVLGVFGLVCFRTLKERAEAGRGMPEYSVYSEDRDGLGPAAALLQKLGYEPVALTRPIQHTAQREATN